MVVARRSSLVARRSSLVVSAVASVAMQACADPAPPAVATDSRADDLSLVGVERVVPLRVISLPPLAGQTENGSWENIAGSVQVTNQAFRNAGVQFQIASLERFTNLPVIESPTQPGRFCNDSVTVIWSVIKADLTLLFPAIASFPTSSLPPSGATATVEQWLYYAASRFSPPEELVFFVPACTRLYGPFPHEGRFVTSGGAALGDWWKFAHEMGHVFSITHSDAAGYPDSQANSAVCRPNASASCDFATGQGLTSMIDFWDMVYLPGTSGTNKHQVFNSRAEAAQAGVANLRWIVDGKEQLPGTGHRCTVDQGVYVGRMRCRLPGSAAAPSYFEDWDTNDSATKDKLRGYMWPTGDGRNGRAMMTYQLEPAASERDAHAGFSDSQANLIRLNLHFDQPIQASIYSWVQRLHDDGVTAGRPLLGRALRRRPYEMIDFDDDGKRDIAAYFPATTPSGPTGVGVFRVFGSRTSFATQTEMPFGQLGDIPVVADYNGDGITDYAVLHDGGGPNTNDLVWRWCLSTRGAAGAAPTHSCASPGTHGWGNRGDVPLPGTRLNSTSAGELTVYRPSNATLYTSVPYTSYTGRALGLSADERAQTPFVGYFDGDGNSDFAFYNPKNATFSLWLSSSSWTTRIDRPFCAGTPCPFVPTPTGTFSSRGGAVPLWGLVQQRYYPPATFGYSLSRSALGLWDPADGTWNVMWDPLGSSAMETHQWGVPTDIVVADAVDRKSFDSYGALGARSSLVAYRSDSTSGPGTFHVCAFTAGAYNCPSGAYTPVTVPGGQRRSEVFALPDMDGDFKPELCHFDPQDQSVRCARSDSGYVNNIVVKFKVDGATPPFTLVGGQLL